MATTAETHSDNNVMMTHEAQPVTEKMTHVAQPNDEKMTCEAQPNDEKTTHEAQPNNEKMNHEAQPNEGNMTLENQPNEGNMTQAQPKGMMNPQIQPKYEKMSPEAKPKYEKMSPEAEPNDEGIPEPHPHDLVMNPEVQPHDVLLNSETQPHDVLLNSETQPHNVRLNSETQPHHVLLNPETQPHDAALNPETQPHDAALNPDTRPHDAALNPETQPHEALNPDTQPHDAALNPETQPHDAALNPDTLPHDAALNPETLPHDAALNPEIQPHDAAVNPETQPHDAAVNPETQPHEAAVNPETQPHDAAVNPETQPHDAAVNPETQPHDAAVNRETQPHDAAVNPETQPHDAAVNPETQPHDATVNTETQLHDVMMTPETQPHDAMMTPETQPHDAMMFPDTQPHNVWMTPETQPQDVVMTHKTQPHDLVMTSETQPHDEMMTPETQLDNELIESEQPNNALAVPETQPNNAFAVPASQPNNPFVVPETQRNNAFAVPETQPNNAFLTPETQPMNEFAAPETHPNNALAIVNTQPNNEVTSAEIQPNKRRKKKSIVWEHFTIETVSAGCRRACCNQCKQSFAYSTGSKVAGTSHLKRHIAKGTCPALLRNRDNNQLTPYAPRAGGSEPPKRRYRSPSLPYISFDQDRCRHEIARMIIMHDYPLHMVEHPGFITFVQNLQPRFDKVSFNTVQGDCVATYLREKQSLMKFIEGIPGRFCLTLDLWTSSQTLGYVFITGHFIDSEWKLQRRILNVVMEPYPESDTAFTHAVAACISDWSLEGRVFSLTYSHPLTEDGLEYLRPLLCIKNPLILNGQLLVGNCIARTLSSMTKDVLAAGREIVKKIRDSVKYVKTSESHEEKFLELKQQLQVPSEMSLSLDDQTKWNTTYHMLVAASELKEVFSCLDTCDPDYKESPSMEDWRLVETLCAFLKPLFDAANILTTTTSPTVITFFHEAWKILSDLTRSITNEDPVISSINKAMLEKIDKYWKDCCLVLAIAVVMDPRFKMKLVEFSFTKIYGEDAPTYVKIVDDGIHELFLEYVALPLPLTPTYDEGNAGNNMKTDESQGGTLLSDNGLADFDMYIMETTGQLMKSELDQYLDESLLPRAHDFDVLSWWKLNKMKYPTLSKMARDILSIPVCSVGNDSVFDTESKEMDQYRSSLRPETVEALICAKDWFQYGSSETSNALVKMEL